MGAQSEVEKQLAEIEELTRIFISVRVSHVRWLISKFRKAQEENEQLWERNAELQAFFDNHTGAVLAAEEE